jgi:hypothetical protein
MQIQQQQNDLTRLKQVLQKSNRNHWRKKLVANNQNIEESMVFITPEMANELLHSFHPINRVLNERKVAEYRNTMRNRQWNPDLPDSTLIFGKDGNLKNGQHRLTAALLEGFSFWSRVEIGHTNDILLHLDQHLPRSEKAQARVLGRPPKEADLYAAVKMLYQIEKELTYFPLAKFEVYNLIDNYYNPDIFQIVPDSLIRDPISGNPQRLLAPMKATLLFLAQYWPTEVREFIRQVREMDFKGGRDSGPGKLHQYITVSKDYLREKASEGRWKMVMRTFKAFHLFLEGANRDRLREGTDAAIAIRRMIDPNYVPKEDGPFAKRRNKKSNNEDN